VGAQHRARIRSHASALLLLVTLQRAQGPEVGAVALPADIAEAEMGILYVLLQILPRVSVSREWSAGSTCRPSLGSGTPPSDNRTARRPDANASGCRRLRAGSARRTLPNHNEFAHQLCFWCKMSRHGALQV
jgi:hypothetical protein